MYNLYFDGRKNDMEILTYGATLTGSTGINRDSFYISPDKKVFILSDGASGAGKEGKVIMSNTCVEIAKKYDFSTSNLDPKEYVDSLFYKMNNKLIEISQHNRQRFYGTIIITVLNKNTLTVTTLGDSQAFLFSDRIIKRLAKNKLKYEDMIDQGYITRNEYEGYIRQMHERMQRCFDWFLPEVVPNNIIEQYIIKQDDLFFMCSDGLADRITPDIINETIKEHGIKDGTDILINLAKEISLDTESYYDDITAVAIHCC
jgi:serine/threonine protein phosphatase PrpC